MIINFFSKNRNIFGFFSLKLYINTEKMSRRRNKNRKTKNFQNGQAGTGYVGWYERNKNNPLIWITDFVFDNFVFFPTKPSPLMGLVRFVVYVGIMATDPFNLTASQSIWVVLWSIFGFVQILVSLFQFVGFHTGSPSESGHVSYGRVDPPVYSEMSDNELLEKFPGIKSWFNTRETYMRGMTASEQARFFVETGGMTTGSVREMSGFPTTKRALERLDFELKRPAKEQVEFMRGKNMKK